MNLNSIVTGYNVEMFATIEADRKWFEINGCGCIRMRPSTSCELVLAPDVPMSFVIHLRHYVASLVPPQDVGLIHK